MNNNDNENFEFAWSWKMDYCKEGIGNPWIEDAKS